MLDSLRTVVRAIASVAVSAATVVFAIIVVIPVTAVRDHVLVTRLIRVDHRRIDWASAGTLPPFQPRRPVAYLWSRIGLGVLALCILVLIAAGGWISFQAVIDWAAGETAAGVEPDAGNITYLTVVGLVLGFLAFQGLLGVSALERRAAAALLGPHRDDALHGRIDQLARTRSEVVAAVDTERQRIERVLHDGVQQRLVALGVLLGRARRRGSHDRLDLLEQAHRETQVLSAQLREVAWRIYPAELDKAGLERALENIADRSTTPVRLRYQLTERPPGHVETAAYFVVSEAVTNATKHAAATLVTVEVEPMGNAIRVSVTDDGEGGADPEGVGINGLARRVAALDGRFRLVSPPGGPTRLAAELPCV